MGRILSAVANMLKLPFKALWCVCVNSNIESNLLFGQGDVTV